MKYLKIELFFVSIFMLGGDLMIENDAKLKIILNDFFIFKCKIGFVDLNLKKEFEDYHVYLGY